MSRPALRTVARPCALAVAAVVLLAGCAGNPAIQTAQTPSPSVSVSTTPPETPSPTVSIASPSPSLSPDTPTEPSANPAEPGRLDAVALMSLAGTDASTGNVVLGGFVVGVVESGGSCIYALTRAGVEAVQRTTEGTSNVDNTSCGSVDIPATGLASGTYDATLTYENSQGRTTSEPLSVEVSS